MKASELISQLQELVGCHGDLDVRVGQGQGLSPDLIYYRSDEDEAPYDHWFHVDLEAPKVSYSFDPVTGVTRGRWAGQIKP